MHNFRGLRIWQEAMEVTKAIYKVTARFPTEERYGLTSQINRSAVSVPSNIAEGAGRNSDKELNQFLGIALGSAFELETQLILAESFGFTEKQNASEIINQIHRIQKMINAFKATLYNRI